MQLTVLVGQKLTRKLSVSAEDDDLYVSNQSGSPFEEESIYAKAGLIDPMRWMTVYRSRPSIP